MVNIKPLSKHGLDRKFKTWRRGKSKNSNKRSSLKQQLRGIERLLLKVPDEEKERREELEVKVRALRLEIDDKQKIIQEKNNAEKAHGQRFLDRQRLTRMEKHVRKEVDSSEKEAQLLKIALDQVYVAHHPTDIKYSPLFRKGQRVVDTSRHLFRRAVTRRRILTSLTKDKQTTSWISKDQYERLPTSEWTIQDEEKFFGGSITRKGMKEVKKKLKEGSSDSRFALVPEHNAVLQMAQQIDAELDDDKDRGTKRKVKDATAESAPSRLDSDQSGDASSSSDDDDDDDDDESGDLLDPLERLHAQSKDSAHIPVLGDSSDSSDADDSSSSEDDEEGLELSKQPVGGSGSSDTSSDSSSSSVKDEKEQTEHVLEDEEVDDFLMDANSDEDENVFSMTLKQVPALGEVRGDKTKGWETQKQRPGQFKKPRVRR